MADINRVEETKNTAATYFFAKSMMALVNDCVIG